MNVITTSELELTKESHSSELTATPPGLPPIIVPSGVNACKYSSVIYINKLDHILFYKND